MRLLFFLLVSNSLFSQVTLRGFVKDTLQNPLAYANIIAKPKDNLKDMAFTLADDIGYYALDLKKGKTYFLEISFMGYKTINDTISISEKTIKNFNLSETLNTLDAVEIELPVVMKEDTIQYRIEKFTNGKERKLKNILKKLPGMEVSKKGKVTVLGKTVSTILVDNKPFFCGGTKLAIENIPADAVKSIQALDNYNEVGFLKKVSKSGDMVINVKLKKDKKKFIFGDIEAKKGNKKFYDAHTNLYYYSEKTKVNSIVNSNNINKEVFGLSEFMKFTKTDYNSVFENLKDNTSLKSFTSLKDITKSKELFGALNLQNTISENLYSDGFIIYSNKNQNSFTESTNNYIDFTEKSDASFGTKSNYIITNLSFNYIPNIDEVWDFKTKLDALNSSNDNAINTAFNNLTSRIANNASINTKSLNQTIEFHKDYGKHIVSAIAQYAHNKNNTLEDWSYSKSLLNQNTYIQQQQLIKNYSFSTIFKEFWMVNKDNHLYTTIGNSYKECSFNSENKIAINNTINYNFHDFFIGSKYHVRLGKTTVKLGANYHLYNWEVNNNKKQKGVLLPNFRLDTKLTSSKNVSFDYSMKSTMADVVKFANNPVYTSYNSVFEGNPTIENELYHNLLMSYSQFNMYRGLNINLNLFYTKKEKGYTNTISRNNYSRIIKFDLMDNASELLFMNSYLSKKTKSIKYNLSFNASTTNYVQVVDNRILKNKNHSISYDFNVETNQINPTISLGFKQDFSFYITSDFLCKVEIRTPSCEMEYIFLKDFTAKFDYEYNKYLNSSVKGTNSYQLANFELVYQKENSPWTFDCKMSNIFNSQFKQQNSFSNFLISETRNYIMPRIVMFGISYKL